MKSKIGLSSLVIVSLCFASGMGPIAVPALAQDTRTVVEPMIPAPCAVLEAGLTAVRDGQFASLRPEDERRLDTQRIQSALDSCGRGKAVVLRSGGRSNAFLSGPLELRAGVALVVDRGTTLFRSVDARLFDVAPGSCGIVNTAPGPGCRPFIAITKVKSAAIMGDGVIDGRGGIKLLGGSQTSWEIGQQSRPGAKRLTRMIVAEDADDFTLYRITLRNSPYFHVAYAGGDGFTAWGVKIDTPRREGKVNPLSRNTDGIDPGGGARNITITRSFIRTGDDNIAIKGGTGGASNITISDSHFYWGHGMSIGSQTHGGVSKVRVTNLTLDGTASGIRIKSAADRGGIVSDVEYSGICIRDSDKPIDIAASYSANNAGHGDRIPIYRDIRLRNVRLQGGGTIRMAGYDEKRRAGILLDDVAIEDGLSGSNYAYDLAHLDVTIGAGGTNLRLPRGGGVTVKESAPVGNQSQSCENQFVPFPADVTS